MYGIQEDWTYLLLLPDLNTWLKHATVAEE